MLQIIFALAGLVMLVKGNLAASKTRTVPARIGRPLGVALLVAAAVPFILPASLLARLDRDLSAMLPSIIMLGIGAIAAVVGLALSEPTEKIG
jgi:drug/metabolite transporter (DMT)-like permease